jgi:hypothetical protein
MRKISLIRSGVALSIAGVVAAGGAIAACGNGDDFAPPAVVADSGADVTQSHDTGTGADGTAPADGAAEAEAGPTVAHAKVLFVHASPDAPALRLCFGVSRGDAATATAVQATFPAPNTAGGLPPGLGGPASDPGQSLAGVNVTFYGIPAALAALDGDTADAGASEKTCKDLLGSILTGTAADTAPDGGLSPSQYFTLGTVPAGTLVDGTSWLFAITGCLPNSPVETALPGACGHAYTAATGSLGIQRWQLDNTTAVAANSIGAQFVHASQPYEAAIGTAIAAGFYTLPVATDDGGADAGDAAPPTPTTMIVADGVTAGSLAPATLRSVQGVAYDGTSGFFVIPVNDAGMPEAADSPKFPLPFIEQISWPSGVPTGAAFQNGEGYVFVLLGNPGFPTIVPPAVDAGAGATPTFDPRGVHILGFPTNPPVSR